MRTVPAASSQGIFVDTVEFALSKTRFGRLKNTGDKDRRRYRFRAVPRRVFMHFFGPQSHGDSVEDAVGRVTGDRIIGADVKVRAERKLGGTLENPPRVRDSGH